MDFAARAERYARAVVSGAVVAGKWAKAACQRHLDDLARAEQDERGELAKPWPYRFDEAEANRACQFIELLPHVKGDQAKPVRTADAVFYPKIELEDWQIFFVAVLFGWRHGATQLRRFRRAYLEVARKNAKTTVLAGIALYMLAADGEQGAEIYSAATKKDQARIVFELAQEMIRREPEFKQLGVGYTKTVIFNALAAGVFKPLARDYGSLDGLNTSCFISDELHAQRDRGLYDVLDSSTGARSQPLGVGITTAGTDRSGVCYAQRTYTTKLLNAVLHRHDGMGYRIEGSSAEDDAYFGIIYTLDSGYADGRVDDDWADPLHWAKANPMLLAERNAGYARTLLADLVASCQKAVTMASEQGEFRTKRANEWIGADSAWMDMRAWNLCADPELREEEFRGAECQLGLDCAFKTDVFAKIKIFERAGIVYAFAKFYVPRRLVDMKGNEHLRAWEEEGRITVCDGEIVNVAQVKDDMRADQAKHVVKQVQFDPAQLTQFAGEMIEEGFVMVELRPTVLNFSEPMKRLEELVLQRKFRHDGCPVLEWMVSNVVCHRDHKDNIYPNKDKPENKIDGIVALILALWGLQLPPQEEKPIEVAFVEL
jgi:phage terminase large subunit-like protein